MENVVKRFPVLRASIVSGVCAGVLTLTGCGGGGGGGGDAEGTWVDEEEGTIVIESGGSASITQSAEPVPLEWEMDGNVVQFTFEGEDEVISEATLDGDVLTFRLEDFSQDEPVTFTRQ